MKRNNWLIACSFLTLAILACGQSGSPTPTAYVAPTATAVPPTSVPEVPSATGSPTESSAEPSAEPTAPPVQPTAPSPTVPPTSETGGAPQILSFTADPTSIVQGDEVTFSWEATGGTEAWIQWTDNSGMLATISVDPDGGSETFAPVDALVNLLVQNSVGADSVTIELDIACAYAWAAPLADNPPSTRCPSEAQVGAAAQQPFENGFMVWFGPTNAIYVFYNQDAVGLPNRYRVFPDAFVEGDPESDPAIVPPAGLYQPVRGFGLLWRTQPEVRDLLGWATAPEAGFDTWLQYYAEQAMHVSANMLQGIDGTIYQLSNVDSGWRAYAP
ncbi:MAG: hypothetical protein JXD18_03450 [Anaerolineae bacterium]|nr:hypothetical protein [Anaerolineae bacterium]